MKQNSVKLQNCVKLHVLCHAFILRDQRDFWSNYYVPGPCDKALHISSCLFLKIPFGSWFYPHLRQGKQTQNIDGLTKAIQLVIELGFGFKSCVTPRPGPCPLVTMATFPSILLAMARASPVKLSFFSGACGKTSDTLQETLQKIY